MAGERSFTSLGISRQDLELAWKDRLRDAEILLEADRPAASMAAALYALEIRLKALICMKLDLASLPRAFEFHYLDGLLVASGLSRRLETKGAIKVKKNWDRVTELAQGLNEFRYMPDGKWRRADAAELLDQLTHPKIGVLTWLSKAR